MIQITNEFSFESNIFSKLSHPSRFQIMTLLQKKNLTTPQISKELKTTIQGIQKHLSQLIESNLIEKNIDGTLFLTPLGQISLLQIPAIRFFTNNNEYFLNHDLADIPHDLSSRIGELSNSKLLLNMFSTLNQCKKIVNSTKKYLFCIFLQPPIMIGDLMKNQLQKGIEISLLFGQNSIIPPNSEMIELLELKTKTLHYNLHKRRATYVGLNLIMNEKTASLFFVNKNGVTDLYKSFTSFDPKFHKWCNDFFNYKWKDAEPFARLR